MTTQSESGEPIQDHLGRAIEAAIHAEGGTVRDEWTCECGVVLNFRPDDRCVCCGRPVPAASYREQRRPGEFESVQIVDQKLHDAANHLNDAISDLRAANEHALWLPAELEKFLASDLLTLLDGARRLDRMLDDALAYWQASLRPQEDPR